MLKFFFACLLLANGALFAYQRGYLDTLIPDGREPSRASRQLNADKIKLISASEAAAAAAPSASAISNAPASAIDPVADAEKKPDAVAVIACTEIGNFIDADALKFEKQLASLTLGDRLSRRKIEEISSRIVAIPSQGSKEGADKKANELRRFGITDFFIIKDPGNLQWGISLGVYKTQDAAQNRLVDLVKKGVHSARITPYSTSSTKVAFQLRNLDMTTKEAVEKIKGGFPQQEVRSCI
ncbi:MAG: SPOR domain-containing protein [Burkholderiaceae bacterium]